MGRSYLSNHSQALFVGAIELFLSLLLCALLIGLRTMRPLLGRLMLVGLIAGICELFTDASGQQVVHSLIYPPGEVTIWASPVYMPLTWMVTLTYMVLLFEGLVVAALPLLSYHIERRPWLEVAALGVVVGGWIAVAALIAWLILGH